MATFRVLLIGSPQPLLIDVQAGDVVELAEQASRSRFLTGNMTEPDEDGLCAGIMIQSGRIQCAFEA